MDNKSKARKLAEEITSVLKFNPQLTEDEKTLCIELRLVQFSQDIEEAAKQAHKRATDNAVIVDSRPQDIPELQALILSSQAHRGSIN
jgi:hypothetical protein